MGMIPNTSPKMLRVLACLDVALFAFSAFRKNILNTNLSFGKYGTGWQIIKKRHGESITLLEATEAKTPRGKQQHRRVKMDHDYFHHSCHVKWTETNGLRQMSRLRAQCTVFYTLRSKVFYKGSRKTPPLD